MNDARHNNDYNHVTTTLTDKVNPTSKAAIQNNLFTLGQVARLRASDAPLLALKHFILVFKLSKLKLGN